MATTNPLCPICSAVTHVDRAEGDYMEGGAVKRNMKHTPGPWVVDALNLGTVGSVELPDGTCIAQAMQIVGMAVDRKQESRKANARLIAAAPELLEACKRARDRMYVHQSAATKEAVRLCDEAIAKAEGVDPAKGAATADKPSRDAKDQDAK